MKKNTLKKPTLFSKATRQLKNKTRQISNIPIIYQYEDFSIILPAHHLLPTYQQECPKYDRFLPHLAKYMKNSETIVDVGANVGDTLAGMVEQNPTASYICIEPDTTFYTHLQKNIERIKKSIPYLKVHTVKALVGKNISSVSLEGNGGTKHAVVNSEGTIESKPLDKLISEATHPNIRLLKTDVDGFDYDVLDSSIAVIQKHKPILFFELQYDFEYQKDGYTKTLLSLKSEGYCDWTIFDNFGEVMIRTRDINVILQLMHYVWNQNTGDAKRTIYYYDVLAVQKTDSALIDQVLAAYQ
jgi:FkbM family methyltransferase